MLKVNDIVELEDNLVMLTKLQNVFTDEKNKSYVQFQIDKVRLKIIKLRREAKDEQQHRNNQE